MVILLLVKQSLAFLEEVIAGRVGIVRIGSRVRLAREAASQSQQRVNEDGRAEPGSAFHEIPQEVLLAERGKSRVLPAEVEC